MRPLLRARRVPAEERAGRPVRGFLSLEPDEGTRARLAALQNRLRDALTRQGVHFPDRLGATLLAWPFGTPDELAEAVGLLRGLTPGDLQLSALRGEPNGDRPAEVGTVLAGVESLQAEAFARLRAALDPDPPKPAFLRLVRVSPPSRKVGVALHGSGLLGEATGPFRARALALWRQTPDGFAVAGEIPLG